MGRASHIGRLALSLFVAGQIIPSEASAFGTIAGLGQHNEHQKITRQAFASSGMGPKTLAKLAGTTFTFGAVGAPDAPWHGLISVSKAHCDNGDYLAVDGYPQSEAAARQALEDCRTEMISNLDSAVAAAGGVLQPGQSGLDCNFKPGHVNSAKREVLARLGLAFHASQDFYSHTNWVDTSRPGPISVNNPPGLGHAAPAPWLDPRLPAESVRTEFPVGLISGCWHGTPEFFHCGRASAHPHIRHAVLNKDFGEIKTGDTETTRNPSSERGKTGDNFKMAVHVAIADTADKWAYFGERVTSIYGADKGRRILCIILNDADIGCPAI